MSMNEKRLRHGTTNPKESKRLDPMSMNGERRRHGAGAIWPPLAGGLVAHAGEGYLGFHMPGHHQGRAAWAPWRKLLGDAVFDLDLTELPGLDNLQDPQGIIRSAEAEAAACFGAEETRFLVNGASAGILAVLLATCREGDLVLVPRNCHQSVVHGLVLSGATPVYLPVHFHSGLGMPGLLRTEDLRACLETLAAAHGDQAAGAHGDRVAGAHGDQAAGAHGDRRTGAHGDQVAGALSHARAADLPPRPDQAADLLPRPDRAADPPVRQTDRHAGPSPCNARLLVLPHPNYYGLAGDLAGQIELALRWGLTVLADEAHGSHFCSSPLFPVPALAAGADFTVQGAHKTLGAFTQAAWLHFREGGGAAARVALALRLVQTTSPSYLLLASLDVARRQLQRSVERWEETARLGLRLREEISRIPGLQAPGEELLEAPGVTAWDPARLVVNVGGLGITGFAAADWLRSERRILVEMADLANLVFILGPGDEGPAGSALARLADMDLGPGDEGPAADALLAGLQALAAAHRARPAPHPTAPRRAHPPDGHPTGWAPDRMGTRLDGHPAGWAPRHGGNRVEGHPAAPELSAIIPALYDLPIPCQALTPRQAFFAPRRQVTLAEAAGKIAAATIAPYPPGIPVICPGEVIDAAALDCLAAWRRAGGAWPGMDRDAIAVIDGS
jgi:arginine/lysine/ornithine decarboxylase